MPNMDHHFDKIHTGSSACSSWAIANQNAKEISITKDINKDGSVGKLNSVVRMQ